MVELTDEVRALEIARRHGVDATELGLVQDRIVRLEFNGDVVLDVPVAGLHATWDCPLRYVEQCGFCPGFHKDGSKDLAQWMPNGEVLTRAAKEAWIELIRKKDLPIANESGARAPDFRK